VRYISKLIRRSGATSLTLWFGLLGDRDGELTFDPTPDLS
jgi:hypothetical protein